MSWFRAGTKKQAIMDAIESEYGHDWLTACADLGEVLGTIAGLAKKQKVRETFNDEVRGEIRRELIVALDRGK